MNEVVLAEPSEVGFDDDLAYSHLPFRNNVLLFQTQRPYSEKIYSLDARTGAERGSVDPESNNTIGCLEWDSVALFELLKSYIDIGVESIANGAYLFGIFQKFAGKFLLHLFSKGHNNIKTTKPIG